FGCLLLWSACAKEKGAGVPAEGTPLRMAVSFGADTRLAELPNPDEMAVDKNGLGLYDVGVYVYYTEDFENDDLSSPYVRNMRFTVENGTLVAVTDSTVESDRYIYIYDHMTIVAFYPYNEAMNLEENHF
ncbi:MAG: fimbrillin family protein, partial [Rikenellaceae bacterium]|nr:fimbrillin family protein [Rikenellaceae bacterium]